ncbi:MAG: imidazolonepropionase [Bacillota bacterium]|nr:imidazolonepropionase [Bacillota bacterium]
MNKMLIYGASELVTMGGAVSARCGEEMNDIGLLQDHSVVIEDGVIKQIIPTKDVSADAYRKEGYEVVDASGCSVTPGFVDSHTHFVFGGYRADEYDMRLKGKSYMEIMNAGGGIVSSVNSTRQASFEELYKVGYHRLNSMMANGVTTVEGKSGYGLDYETEMKQLEVMKALNEKHPLDVVSTFMGPHAVPPEWKSNRGRFMRDMISMLTEVKQKGLAEYADIFCEDGVFSIEESRTFLLAASQTNLKLKIHADEIVTFGGAELAAELKTQSADHLLKASDEGLMAMKRAGVVATLLPLTAFSLNEPFARGRYMIDNGLAVALATDFNPGSCFSESLPLLIAIATNKMKLTMEETLTAITINGAAAVGRADKIGSIAVGKRADFVIHEFPSYKFMAYHIGVSTTKKVIKNGVLVYERNY